MKVNLFKRIVALLTSIIIGIGIFANLPLNICIKAFADDYIYSGQCGENVFWGINNNGILILYGNGSMYDYEYYQTDDDYRSPWFALRKSIKEIKVYDGITYIGRYAFAGCDEMERIDIPSSVEMIATDALLNCNNLTTCKIDNPNTDIEYSGLGFAANTVSQIDMYNTSNLTILASDDSSAHRYADENSISFQTIDYLALVRDLPSNRKEYNNHYYYVYSELADTWEEAEEYCREAGGHLAVINNEEENTAVYDMMIDFGYKSAYFGYTDTYNEGNWHWIDGYESDYVNWNLGEPNSENSGEDYAMFYYKYKYTWNDGDFGNHTVNDSKAFICEWESNVTSNLSPQDDLLSYIENKSGYAVIDFVYLDMDHDNSKEMIAVIQNDSQYYECWYCNSNKTICKMVYRASDLFDYCSLKEICYLSESHVIFQVDRELGTGRYGSIFALYNGEISCIVKDQLGSISLQEDKICLTSEAYDYTVSFGDGFGIGHTFKDTYIYYVASEHKYKEYGGLKLSYEDFLKFDNAIEIHCKIIEKLSNDNINSKIDFVNFFVRENGVCHIQYTITDDYGVTNRYFTYEYNGKVINPNQIENNGGIMSSYFSSLEVTYPDLDLLFSDNTYTVTWVNDNGITIYEEEYNVGNCPTYDTAKWGTPVSATGGEFVGWSKTPSTDDTIIIAEFTSTDTSYSGVNGDITYCAIYKNDYVNITWNNGTKVIDTSICKVGEIPQYKGELPTGYYYEYGLNRKFIGWTKSDNSDYVITIPDK